MATTTEPRFKTQIKTKCPKFQADMSTLTLCFSNSNSNSLTHSNTR